MGINAKQSITHLNDTDLIVGVILIGFGIIVSKVAFELIVILLGFLVLSAIFNNFIKVALSK